MGELAILDNSGDSKIMWDVRNKDEIDAAESQFDSLIKKGFTAYSVKKDGEKNQKIKFFDPDAGKIILVPPIIGG
jgi:hypothetical protein